MSRMPAEARSRMVERQLARRGIRSAAVLYAMRAVPREVFVPDVSRHEAYEDRPLPIGEGQTISQPYVVALMIEALSLDVDDRVLEVGAGSGYAAAVLGRIVRDVYAIERHASLARAASERMRRLGYDNVRVREGDGTLGWPEEAPFDAILVSAGGPEVPTPLLDQLASDGRLVIPLGDPRKDQDLVRFEHRAGGAVVRESLGHVRFVPLIGEE